MLYVDYHPFDVGKLSSVHKVSHPTRFIKSFKQIKLSASTNLPTTAAILSDGVCLI